MLKDIIMITYKKIEKLRELEEECKQKKIDFFYFFPEKITLISETLYITDSREIYLGLKGERANVLVWVHEENKNQNFPEAFYVVENIEEINLKYLEQVYMRQMKIPWTIAETKRCIIREMTVEDLDEIYNIYEGKNITKYMEGLYEDREEEKEFIASYIEHAYKFYGYGTWVIYEKELGVLIGRVGYNLREGYEDPELGFVIAERYQNKGYGYECCKAVIAVGKEEYGFEQIQALVKEKNKVSISLCEKLGLHQKRKVIWEGEEYLYFHMRI